MSQTNSSKFLKGAAILGIAGIVVKIMGVFFRIPLSNWVGESGISYYSSVYPIYTLFLVVSTAGIPVAISRMVSERISVKNYEGAHRVFRTSLWLLGGIGLVSFAIMYLGAGFIEKVVLNNPGTYKSLQAIAPALFFVPIMSAYRGYFQGRQNMNPTAVSQIFEQFARVVIGLSLAHYLMPLGYEDFCAGATFGATAGAVVGLVVIIAIYLMNLKAIRTRIRINRSYSKTESTGEIIKKILLIAIPITIGAAILPLMGSIDTAVVMRRLQATGWTLEESRSLWGRLGGYCNSLIGFPQVFTQAIVMSLVPAISAAFSLRDKTGVQENIKLSLRTSMLIGLPCAVGIFSLAEPILLLLYPMQAAGAMATVPTLMVMSVSIIFMSSLQTFTGVLQGIDKQMIPVKNLAIGMIGKLVVTYVCVGIRAINIIGAPLGTIVAYIIASALNFKAIKRYTDTRFDIGLTFGRPAAASAVMGICAFSSYKLLFALTSSNSISTLLAIVVGVLVYGVLVLALRCITKEEIVKLPKGDKLVKLLGKFMK